MKCEKTRAIDLAAYLLEPGAAGFEAFRRHYPGCAECSAELAGWTRLESALREGAPGEPAPTAHPAPALLAAFDAQPKSLPAERWQALDRHLRGCRPCADELAALRGFEHARVEARAPISTPRALRQAARSLSEGLRGRASRLADRAREVAGAVLPVEEPAVQFQSAEGAAPAGVLVAIDGPLSGQVFPVPQGESRLGRAPECEMRFTGADMARIAARLHAEPGTIEIASLNARAPVRVNGKPVERGSLADGDLVELGGLRLRFRMTGS